MIDKNYTHLQFTLPCFHSYMQCIMLKSSQACVSFQTLGSSVGRGLVCMNEALGSVSTNRCGCACNSRSQVEAGSSEVSSRSAWDRYIRPHFKEQKSSKLIVSVIFFFPVLVLGPGWLNSESSMYWESQEGTTLCLQKYQVPDNSILYFLLVKDIIRGFCFSLCVQQNISSPFLFLFACNSVLLSGGFFSSNKWALLASFSYLKNGCAKFLLSSSCHVGGGSAWLVGIL